MLMEELRDYYGTWSNMSRTLGLGYTTYLNWIKKGFIPLQTQRKIEYRTKSKFKADLSHAAPQN